MVYTLVLEASAERIESSSLSRRTIIWGSSTMGVHLLCKQTVVSSSLIFSTNFREYNENTKTSEPRCTCADEAWRRWFTYKKPQTASWPMEAQYGRIT